MAAGRQTHPSRPLIAPTLAAIRRRKASLGEEVTKSICFAVAEPPPPSPSAAARRCVPSPAIQAKHGPLSTLARRVITPDWERAERRISPLCYFSRSGLQSQSSRQTSSPLLSSLHTVVALQPVYSHTPRGTLTSDL